VGQGIQEGALKPGEVGTIVADDNDDQPYNVRAPSGETDWYKVSDVVDADAWPSTMAVAEAENSDEEFEDENPMCEDLASCKEGGRCLCDATWLAEHPDCKYYREGCSGYKDYHGRDESGNCKTWGECCCDEHPDCENCGEQVMEAERKLCWECRDHQIYLASR
jgi:hypothetical protein